MNVLVIDVGGNHVKILLTGEETRRRFESGPKMTAADMVEGVKKSAEGWEFDVVSLGYPAPVLRGRPVSEPRNLAAGWVGFDFERAFGCPVKLINDAAMQALGSYQGGRMLFLGLGTGLGSAMIVDGVVEPMELAHLPFRKATFEDYVGDRGLKRLGEKRWSRRVAEVVETFAAACNPVTWLSVEATSKSSKTCRRTRGPVTTTTHLPAASGSGKRTVPSRHRRSPPTERVNRKTASLATSMYDV